MRNFWLVAFLFSLSARGADAQEREVRISVLGLFHTTEVVISRTAKPLTCAAGEDRWPVGQPLHLVLDQGAIRIAETSRSVAGGLTCDDGQGGATEFTLAIPGRISRRYQGRLELRVRERELVVIVAMGLETAVASIVAAESPPQAPREALKAQAVASRSFLLAGKGRHVDFDFCDTTHCQFLPILRARKAERWCWKAPAWDMGSACASAAAPIWPAVAHPSARSWNIIIPIRK
jgi:hypothetical protein